MAFVRAALLVVLLVFLPDLAVLFLFAAPASAGVLGDFFAVAAATTASGEASFFFAVRLPDVVLAAALLARVRVVVFSADTASASSQVWAGFLVRAVTGDLSS
jgi:hypothetical protein